MPAQVHEALWCVHQTSAGITGPRRLTAGSCAMQARRSAPAPARHTRNVRPLESELPYDTDERLKAYLDTNQLHREQMCLAILAVDKRFSEVRPRHPRGGPDGGRDIEALYRDNQRAFAAVGLVNQANDSEEQKKRVREKFTEDLQAAVRAQPTPKAFFFLTNINLTIGEKDSLISQAKASGFTYCEILDRERLRIVLDSPDGLSIRFQYLGLPLSEAEQATFFAKWGDDIQSVIATGFQRVEATLARLLFLQETSDIMSGLTLMFELDRTYAAEEIGHFRAFCYMRLKGPKHKIFAILFGSSDRADRMRDDVDVDLDSQKPGIKHGIGGGQWEQYVEVEAHDSGPIPDADTGSRGTYKQVGSSWSIGLDPVRLITIHYTHDSFIRYFPRLSLRDIDESSFLPVLNASLAQKVKRFYVFSNGYKLQQVSQSDFTIDTGSFEVDIPVRFTSAELSDPWIRIRPVGASAFTISFADQTPRRMLSPRQTPEGLPGKGEGEPDAM